MQYLVVGILKAGAETQLQDHAADFNEHLAQPFRRVSLGGVLRADNGNPSGYVVVIEATSAEDAEQYLHQSPIYRAGLYERYEIAVLDVVVGSIS